VKQGAGQYTVAENNAGRDQGEGRDEKTMRLFAERRGRVRPRPRAHCPRRIRKVALILKRTMHHAETSDASFSRVAAVAVFGAVVLPRVSARCRAICRGAIVELLIFAPAFS